MNFNSAQSGGNEKVLVSFSAFAPKSGPKPKTRRGERGGSRRDRVQLNTGVGRGEEGEDRQEVRLTKRGQRFVQPGGKGSGPGQELLSEYLCEKREELPGPVVYPSSTDVMVP